MTLGEWIAERLPHISSAVKPWGCEGERVFRIFGGKPLYRFCLVDYTKTNFYPGKPGWVRVQVCGWTVYERNREFSGLPGARARRSSVAPV